MRRRDFTAGILLAGSAVTWKQATLARHGPNIPRVGYLGTNIGPASLPPIEAFREGLRQLGYTEGQNIIVEYPGREDQPTPLRRRMPWSSFGSTSISPWPRTPVMFRCSGEQAARSPSSSA